jgi:hypothetical protein
MYRAIAAPIPDAPRTIRNKGITITKKKRGRLDSCVPTNNGHYYSSKNVVA